MTKKNSLHLIQITPTKIIKKRKESGFVEKRSKENKIKAQLQVKKLVAHFSTNPAPKLPKILPMKTFSAPNNTVDVQLSDISTSSQQPEASNTSCSKPEVWYGHL